MRVALIGGGWIAESIAQGIVEHGSELVGVCDRDSARRETWAGRQVPTFADHHGLLAECGADVVFVLTPTESHAGITLDALAAGCHVIVEKPIASSVGEARTMVAAGESAGKHVLVEESYLFMPSHLAAFDLVDAGTIGELRSITHTFYGWLPHEHRAARVALANSTGWRGDGDYPWMRDHLVHLFALSRRFAGGGPPVDVRCFGGPGEASVAGAAWSCGSVDAVWIRASRGEEGVFGGRRGLQTQLVGEHGYVDVLGEGGAWGDDRSTDAIRVYDGTTVPVVDLPDRLWQADVGYYPSAHLRSVSVALDHIAGASGSLPAYAGHDALGDLVALDALIRSADRTRTSSA